MPQEWLTSMDTLYQYSKIPIITVTNDAIWSTPNNVSYTDEGGVFSLQKDYSSEFSSTYPGDLDKHSVLFATLDFNIGINDDLRCARSMGLTDSYTSIGLYSNSTEIQFIPSHLTRSSKWRVRWN